MNEYFDAIYTQLEYKTSKYLFMIYDFHIIRTAILM